MCQSMSQNSPIFDAAEMEHRLLHDTELIKTVLQAFIQDLSYQINLLKELCAHTDISAAERQAHSIKGACANVGALHARDLALEVEKTAHKADMEQLPSLVARLEVAQEPLYTALQDYLARME